MTRIEILQIITGYVGTLGFAILFNIKGRRLLGAAFGGFLSWTLFVLLGNVINSEPIRYFIVSATCSAYAEVMARVLKTPTTTLQITALIPLIPGASLYYTMAYALESDMARFITKAVSTLKLAAALALGIVFTTMIMTVIYKVKGAKRHGNCETV